MIGLRFLPLERFCVGQLHFDALNHDGHMRFSGNKATNWNQEKHDSWLKAELMQGSRVYAIVSFEGPVGTFTLRPITSGVWDFSVLIYPAASGRRIASKTLVLVSRLLTLPTNVHTLQLGLKAGHHAMSRVALNAGFSEVVATNGFDDQGDRMISYRKTRADA